MKLIKTKNINSKIIYSVYKYSIFELVKYGAAGLLAGCLICWLCYHSLYSLPVAIAVMFFYLKNKKKSLIEHRRKQLLHHFKDFIGALHTSLNAGYSVENGMAEAMEDIRRLYGENDVMTQEIKRMLIGLRVGESVEDMFYDLGSRSGLDDIKLFSELLSTGKRHGGRLGKILGDIKHIICGKIETEQEIDKQIAAKKYEQKVMSLMPACVIVYLRLTFSGFIEQLYGNIAGVIIMTTCLAVYVFAYQMGKRIVSIEV